MQGPPTGKLRMVTPSVKSDSPPYQPSTASSSTSARGGLCAVYPSMLGFRPSWSCAVNQSCWRLCAPAMSCLKDRIPPDLTLLPALPPDSLSFDGRRLKRRFSTAEHSRCYSQHFDSYRFLTLTISYCKTKQNKQKLGLSSQESKEQSPLTKFLSKVEGQTNLWV